MAFNALDVAPWDLDALIGNRKILPNRRLPWVVTALGDSRIANIYTDPATRRTRSGASPLNVANALLGQPLVIGTTYGVSGDRTDQMLARLPAVLATAAGTLYLNGGLNDIGQNYPTATTSASTAFANLKTIMDAATAAGMTVICEVEYGSNGINNSNWVAQVNELRALLFEYAETKPGILLHDAQPILMQPAYSATALQFKTGYDYDGTHLSARGGLYHAESLKNVLLAAIGWNRPLNLGNRAALTGNGRRQLLTNPIFTTTTGGTLNTGVTGVLPGSWGASRSGAATATMNLVADADAPSGQALEIVCTFTAAGEAINLFQDAAAADWSAGEIFEARSRVKVIGTPTVLGGVRLNCQSNVDGASADNFDLWTDGTTIAPGYDHACSLTLKTRPYQVPAFTTKGWLNTRTSIIGTGAGTATVRILEQSLWRRLTAYD